MKKIIVSVFILFVIPIINVSAKENVDAFYTNKYNVAFTKEQYDFISQFYWEGYQDNMERDDYQNFINSNIMNGEVETVELNDNMPRSSTVTAKNKNLKISKSCSTNCTISVVATWTSTPTTKSYDVIGAYLKNVNLVTTPITQAFSSTSTNKSTEIKKDGNGFGVSVLLPSFGNNYIVNQTYIVSKGGTVYASYQHATSTISLANSKKYTISLNGYGNVFSFTGLALSAYDGMNGVSISV